MRYRTRVGFSIAVLALAGLQISCGGADSSGPQPVPASVAASSSTNQNGAPGAAVAEPPSVMVHDPNGTPLGGVTVAFTVTSGGGSVTGGSALTNSTGVATVGSWTLGITAGTNTLEAKVGSLAPVTFTANAADPCVITATYALGSTTNGMLTASDCHGPHGFYVDFFRTTVTAGDGSPLLFTLSAAGFNALVIIFTADRVPIGTMGESGTGPTSTLKVFLPPDNFILGLSAAAPNITGSYTLTSSINGPAVTNCERVFAARGVTIAQAVQTSDCPFSGGTYMDEYYIYLTGGQQTRISMNSTTVDSYVIVYAPNGDAAVSNDNKNNTTTDAEILFTPSTTGFYLIGARASVIGQTGPYTLIIQ